MLKKAFSFLVVLGFIAFSALVALADAVAPGAASAVTPVVASAPPSLLQWFIANSTAVFATLLVMSELLSLIPAFKGNGILHTIIEALKALSQKPADSAPTGEGPFQ
jgi:hypothetical protein